MCLGIISIGAGIGRLVTIPILLSGNLSASIYTPYLFVIIEPAFAIICACHPTYRPLALWFGHSISTSRAGSAVRSLLFSSSSSGGQSMDGSRKSRSSALFAKRFRASMNPAPKSEKKGLLDPASASSSPEIDREKGSGDEARFENQWGASGTTPVVSAGSTPGLAL